MEKTIKEDKMEEKDSTVMRIVKILTILGIVVIVGFIRL